MTEEDDDVLVQIDRAIAERDAITDRIHGLIVEALKAGHHPRELPFSHGHIRRVALGAGLPPLKKGPPPRRGTTT